jgi:hypothetical protein
VIAVGFSITMNLYICLMNSGLLCFYQLVKSGTSKLLHLINIGDIKDAEGLRLKGLQVETCCMVITAIRMAQYDVSNVKNDY